MTRGGASKERREGPERRCVATGESMASSSLIRFGISPDGVVTPDVLGRLPGRGVYVSADRAALDKAVAKRLFARGLKQQVTIPEGLTQTVEDLLVRRVVDLLSMARKSGQAVSGYEKVKGWLDKEEARVLLQASDGSGRGKSKLSTPHFGRYIGWLTADELGMAFGRQTVVHAAVASGGLAKRVVEEAHRLKGVRNTDGGIGHLKG